MRIRVEQVNLSPGRLDTNVFVENLGGHKLPTAFPLRRAWLHVVVRDRDHRIVFESGSLKKDGSIQGNDNDADATRFEPHYREIDRPDQVEIYESILAANRASPRKIKDGKLYTATPEVAALFRRESTNRQPICSPTVLSISMSPPECTFGSRF